MGGDRTTGKPNQRDSVAADASLAVICGTTVKRNPIGGTASLSDERYAHLTSQHVTELFCTLMAGFCVFFEGIHIIATERAREAQRRSLRSRFHWRARSGARPFRRQIGLRGRWRIDDASRVERRSPRRVTHVVYIQPIYTPAPARAPSIRPASPAASTRSIHEH